MKKKIAFIFAYIWLFLLLCTGIGILLFADREERPSESEKRMLAGFPELSARSITSGEFFTGFEDFLSDGIFMRDSIARVSENVLGVFSAASYEDTMLLDSIAMADEISGNVEGNDSSAQQSAESSAPEAPPQTETESNGEAQAVPEEAEGFYGLYLLKEDGSSDLLAYVNEYKLGRVAEALNAYKDYLPEDGHVFYSCVPVTSYRDVAVKTGKYVGWHENFVEDLNAMLRDGVHMISSPNVLNEHLFDEHLFFQADHHWTPLAAYYVIEEMMGIQGVPVVPYDEYDYKIGKFYNLQTGIPDDLDMMYPLLPTVGNLMTFGSVAEEVPFIIYNNENYVTYLAGGNHIWSRYSSGFSTGRTALVIGDSFTTAFVPYLMPYYDAVHHADPRYYVDSLNGGSVSTLIDYHGIDDVYIILSYDNGINSPMSSDTLEYLLYD